ncbi:MAG: CRISPR-associated helicase Cas3' [Deltaproteobacteria bacterium]
MFKKATKGTQAPFHYQTSLAECRNFPSLLEVPTGMGKTAAAVLSWIWRRRYAAPDICNETPRRLVYCLPMRVLVEQTRDCAVTWLHNLGLLGGVAEFEDKDGSSKLKSYDPWNGNDDPAKIRVHILMGGEVDRDWDMYPERDAILIGTQDMLLSRALNRGYALSRFRWPVQFGLLNNDCLWVMDEIQLMGNGLGTTTQLQAFRRMFTTAAPVRSLWMSATMNEDWLKTVDFDSAKDALGKPASLEEDRKTDIFKRRFEAKKHISKAKHEVNEDGKDTARLAAESHMPGTLTLVIVNTVKRAQAIYKLLDKMRDANKDGFKADLVLLHTRFRQPDRARQLAGLLATPGEQGTISVCTQVIEAGVDISARTLITELAPWSSLVQRFGRCNRYGEFNENGGGNIIWIPYANLADEKILKPAPYNTTELRTAAERLENLVEAGPYQLPAFDDVLVFTHVPRRKDIIELFDTTPDLAGADIDITQFIRDVDENDVQVFWRAINGREPSSNESRPTRNELCRVSIAAIKQFEKDCWLWDHLDKKWTQANHLRPGLVLMLRATDGGYATDMGWTGEKGPTDPMPCEDKLPEDANESDATTKSNHWQTLMQHADMVVDEMDGLTRALELPQSLRNALLNAARWHDAGKAHETFQKGLPQPLPDSTKLWAKSAGGPPVYDRHHFRHELASAVAMLQNGQGNLEAYLAASHHGKVRLSIRSLPGETVPDDSSRRFARGVWDGDILPVTELGGGIQMPATMLNLAFMEMGDNPETGPSWLARMLELRDSLKPFRLAFLEALMRIADWRASAVQEDNHE